MVVAVASPSSAAPSAGRPHPPYKEMILQALTELRDPSGSSRHAIASYIADHFTGLHARHDALLSVHLRRLSSQGQLRLVSGNYFVSAATPQLGPGQKRGRGRPRKNPDLAPSAPAPVFQGPKRGRGRPRKDALDLVLFSDSPLQGASAPPPPSGVKRGRGRPRKNALVPVPSSSPLLGAISPPPPSRVKRGRGRPRKNALVPVPSSSSQLLGAIAPPPPPPSGVKRGRGRPRKNALVLVPSSSSQLLGAIAPPPPSGVKRGRGRPRKNALVPVGSSSSPLLGATAPWSPSGVKWGRGRPRKNAQGPGGQPQRYITPLSLLPVAMPRSGKSKSDRLPKVAIDNSALPGSSTKISAGSNSVVGAKRGRGRPLKVVVAGKKKRGRPPKEKMRPESVQSVYASLTKRGRGRPRKEKALDSGHLKASQITEGRHEVLTVQAADQTGAVQNEVEAKSLQSGGTLTEKRGRGRPRKRPLETEAAEAAFPGEKRGPGRPRKEMALATEHLKAAQMTEGLHEALPAQAANQAGAVQNEVEPRSLQSCGISLKEKRGLGRPRKRPLETETAETKIAALMKRGRGRPRKESPLAGRSTGTRDTELTEIKRGRGRPRKARPFETGSVETAIEVSRDLTEEKPENDGDLVSGKKAEAQGVLLVEGIDNGPVDAECVVLPEEEVAIASMAAGGVLLSGEESAVAPMDAGGATPRVDPSDSNVGTESH